MSITFLRGLPTDRYERPKPRFPTPWRLDGNEGNVPDEALFETLAQLSRSDLRDYPDVRPLEERIAQRFNISADRVVVTTGADDAIDRCCRIGLGPGRGLLAPVPMFEMLYRFAAAAGGRVVGVPWTDDFPIDDLVASLDSGIGLVACVSPNNPTGRAVSRKHVKRLLSSASDTPVLIDQVYGEYADDQFDLTDLALASSNAILVRTFSKAWGLAGLRVGYAVASPEIAMALRNVGNPYPLSGPSLAAMHVQLDRAETGLSDHVTEVRRERAALTDVLIRLGYPPVPSQGNFLFVDFGAKCDFVRDALSFGGIAVRHFPHRAEIATGLRISLPGSNEGVRALEAAASLALDPEAILLDMDGVLADVSRSYRQCIIETAASFGAVISADDVAAAIRDGDANNDWRLTQRILAANDIDVPLEDVTNRYQTLYLGTDESPGLRESEALIPAQRVIRDLAARVPLAIVTGRPRAEAEWFIERADIGACISATVCLEDAPNKPDPAPIVKALQLLGVRRAWMIGDTPDDIRAATAAGVLPIGIVAPGGDKLLDRQTLLNVGAVTVLPTLEHVETLLS